MDADSSDSGTKLGFSVRRLALAVFLLLVFRGAVGGAYELLSGTSWLAAVVVVVLASFLPLWLFYRYAGSRTAE